MEKIIVNDRSKKNSESSCEKSKTEYSGKAVKRPADEGSSVKNHSSQVGGFICTTSSGIQTLYLWRKAYK